MLHPPHSWMLASASMVVKRGVVGFAMLHPPYSWMLASASMVVKRVL